MAAGFYDLFYQLQGTGFYEFLLPFLLVFTVIFAILEKTKLFGVDESGRSKKNISAVIALVLGLLVVSQFEVVANLQHFLPRITLFIIIAMMVLILIGLFAGDIHSGFGGVLLIIVSLIAVAATYWALAPLMGFGVTVWLERNWPTILIALIVIAALFAVMKGGGDGGGKFNEQVDYWFGKQPRSGGHPPGGEGR